MKTHAKREVMTFYRVVLLRLLLIGVGCGLSAGSLRAQTPQAWQNTSLTADQRADLVLQRMTQAEKLQLVHGIGWGVLKPDTYVPTADNGGAGFVPGIPRLGIPDVNMADSAVGIRMAALHGRYATLLPSTLGAASSWDIDSAALYGTVIGRELKAQGYNMSIGGGVNLTREPRNGRNFEYAGEDPLLAGRMTGNLMKGLQAQHIMGDIKHYAMNDQETGRNTVNVVIDHKAMRESDLLAFEFAIEIAQPSAVMCAYNKINGDYACENDYTLNHVLKQDFGFKGWVMSDWEGTHSTVKAALAGLDQEQPGSDFFGPALERAIAGGQVPQARLDDMVHRILRSMFASGVIDQPSTHRVLDPFQGRDDAQHIAEESIVLLQNSAGVLPLGRSVRSIALIGSHADRGVLSGGGSAQVDPPGGNAADPLHGPAEWGKAAYFPSSPLKEIRSKVPGAAITFDSGSDPVAAAASARHAEVAIVFVHQYMSEGQDSPTLSLPENQDALVSAVAAANPNTIVVLETGGPVSMPWLSSVKGVLAAWYPGIGGAQALANILFGEVNPSGKLPITFAATDADLPHPQVTGLTARTPSSAVLTGAATPADKEVKPFELPYREGVKFGYKWFEATQRTPLFPFGFGLSYTKFHYSGLVIDPEKRVVRFTITNAGPRAGTEIGEVYVQLPASVGEPFRRLAGWARTPLAAGESRTVEVALEPRTLAVFSDDQDRWTYPKGEYRVFVGPSSESVALRSVMQVR